MGWETLDHGLGTGAARGVSLVCGPRKKMGRVAKGQERDSLGTKNVVEFVVGREVIEQMGLKIVGNEEDQYIDKRLRIQWGTGPQMGMVRICVMNDQGLPGLEMRCLRKGTVFKIKSDKLPRLYAHLPYDMAELDFAVQDGTLDMYLPDNFYDTSAPVQEKVRIVSPAQGQATPGRLLEGPGRMMATLPQLEQEAHKVIKGFETDMVGNYYIVLSGQRDKYSAKVILEKVNESRRKRGLPEFVID